MEIITKYRLVISRHARMRVPGVVFATRSLIPDPAADRVLEQVVNVAELPGIVVASYAMPDGHWGYGLPIGGVAATDIPHGVVSPGGVGLDIACEVRLLAADLTRDEGRWSRAQVLPALGRIVIAEDDLPFASAAGGATRSPRRGLIRRAQEPGRSRLAAWSARRGYPGGRTPQPSPAIPQHRREPLGRVAAGVGGFGQELVQPTSAVFAERHPWRVVTQVHSSQATSSGESGG